MLTEDLPFPGEAFLKKVIREKVPKYVLRHVLRNEGGFSEDELREAINNPEEVLFTLGYDKVRELSDNYFASLPKYSVFLFELKSLPFTDIDDLMNCLESKKLKDKLYKNIKISRITRSPKIRLVYYNKSYNRLQMMFLIRGKKRVEVDPRGKLVVRYSLVKSIVTLGPETIANVRINGNFNQAVHSLRKSLEILNRKAKFIPIRFKDLEFVKKVLEFVDRLGYLTLEFLGPGLGKVSYSGRRGRNIYISDLRRLDEVRNKIILAFQRGYITRMHGILRVDNPLYDDKVNFGINFRENKLYVFGKTCEYSYIYLINSLYQIWRGVFDEYKARKGTLLDFISG